MHGSSDLAGKLLNSLICFSVCHTGTRDSCRQKFPRATGSWKQQKPVATLATLPTSERAAAAHEGWIRALGARAAAMGEGPSCSPPCQGQEKSNPRFSLASVFTLQATESRGVVCREHYCLCKWPAGASSSLQGSTNWVSVWHCWRRWGLTHGCNGRGLKRSSDHQS